jgi:hypothetical protein
LVGSMYGFCERHFTHSRAFFMPENRDLPKFFG